MAPSLSWVARPENRKTGPIPTAYVGKSWEEAWDSCEGCALREGPCYAHWGTSRMGFRSIERARALDPRRYTLSRALRKRHRAARAARVTAIGDPARADRDQLLKHLGRVKDAGLSVLGYTHFWQEEDNQELSNDLLASCDQPKQVSEALDLGWIPTLVLPEEFKGRTFQVGDARGLVCPAQWRETTCNECLLCSTDHPMWASGKVDLIGFVAHGNGRKKLPLAT